MSCCDNCDTRNITDTQPRPQKQTNWPKIKVRSILVGDPAQDVPLQSRESFPSIMGQFPDACTGRDNLRQTVIVISWISKTADAPFVGCHSQHFGIRLSSSEIPCRADSRVLAEQSCCFARTPNVPAKLSWLGPMQTQNQADDEKP